jgi:multidrug efflux pump subunit AcrA (membrane-fusion protein)
MRDSSSPYHSHNLPLPKQWPKCVKSAVIHTIGISHLVATIVRADASNSRIPQVRAKAEADEAKADVQVAQAVLDRCVIKAPFSGKVAEIIARPYQSVRIGDPLIEILDDKTLEVEFMAPSRALLKLKPGSHFKVTLDETATSYDAEITRLGGKVDPVSQTIKVYGRIVDKAGELLPGMSGAVEFATIQ